MMYRASAIVAGLIVGLASALALAEPAIPAKAADGVRNLVYWGAGGPIRIRLHLEIAGRPVDAVWSDAVAALFAFCDRNGDGVLDPAEYAFFVEPRRGRDRPVAVGDGSSQPALRLTFEPRDAKVTRAMFENALRDAGFGPAALTVRLAQPNSQKLSATLFRRLDRDGDSKLSLDELRDARERLAFFDANEDEFISVTELLGGVDAPPVRQVAMPADANTDSTDSLSDLMLVPAETGAAVQQILSARGDARRKTIRRTDFAGDEKAFAALDKNHDGQLDAAELEAWLRQDPDLALRIALPTQNEIVLLSKPASGRLHLNASAGRNVEADAERIHFRFEQPVSNAFVGDPVQAIRDRLRPLVDKAGNIQGPKAEVNPRRPDSFDLRAFVTFADRNGDGKLDAQEVDAALKVLAPLLTGCRLTVLVRDQGTGLFELLDRNGDGRLSPRELVEGPEVLKPFVDAAGKVSPDALPRRLLVTVAVAPIPVVNVPAGSTLRIKPVRQDGPAWFYAMDRNGDGDVSLREFVGPIELFRKLDANGDGLISLEEAIRGMPDEANGREKQK